MPHNNLVGLYNYIQLYDEGIGDDMQERLDELVGLAETRKEASLRNQKLQLQVKTLYDKRTMSKKFQDGDSVLMWNARIKDKGKHGKFDPIWLGPYLIENTWGEDSYVLNDLSDNILELPIHERFLKRYFY